VKALVHHGPGQRGWDTVADPTIIDPTDILVRIDTSTICGSDLHILKGDLEKLWTRDATITTGLVDTHTIPQLMRLVASGRLDPTIFATHHYAHADTMSAYDTFADAANTGALKIVLEGSEIHRNSDLLAGAASAS
jgi:threonine dehydrogenase-like Zn-dependent dehydrogenase